MMICMAPDSDGKEYDYKSREVLDVYRNPEQYLKGTWMKYRLYDDEGKVIVEGWNMFPVRRRKKK